ncbi:RagB/SusD family nutrient uptake outer membrane protein [uncultured Prevotella sp.]|uniref:RagB/SusD family nutrient uptake outer membrane protein n=1 Tax=uncultured Prevotella sp. TaxID=159272 RepID=UPI002585E688|nr:RagB/SusD family nutrient uptake outer membrane protein [uncultured Prevotella sp.]
MIMTTHIKRTISRLVLIAVTISASTVLVGCLNEDPRDRISADEAYGTADKLLLNTVGTLYNYIGGNADSQGLQGTVRGVYDFNTFTTDEAMIPTRGGDWYDGGFWQSLYKHSWTASDNALYNTWNYLYKVVMMCDQSEKILNERRALLTDAQLNEALAEVRGLRAMYFFYLMDMYGRIPLVTDATTPVDSIRQSERSETFRYIYNELESVAPSLPDVHSNLQNDYYGRFTRPVAYFLLAKLALNAEVYADDDWTDGVRPDGRTIMLDVDGQTMNAWKACQAWCDKITAEGYELESNYAANFAVHNETSRENIFIIPMDKYLYANQFLYLFRSRHYNHGAAIGQDSENGSCATISTVRTYGYGTDSVDKRYAINFYSDTLRVDGKIVKLDDGTPLVYMPLAVKLDLSGDAYEKTAGARMSKYEIDRKAYSDGKLQSNDIVLFRYADVLLMKAEAKVRNGEDGSAELNAVRSRVGMSPRPATLKTILDERLLELMWEGWRRNDLVRFGLFNKAYDQRTPLDNEQTGYTTVFPIPEDAIYHNANLKQNKGYSN